MFGNAKFSLLILVFFLSGCAGFGQSVSVGQLTSSQVQRLEKISIIQTGSINTKDFKVLKRVKGISCSGDGTIHISKSDAINQLKLIKKTENFNKLVYGLFFLSIMLELFHLIIPNRSFQLGDLIGNILGVIVAYFIIKIYLLFNK